VKILMEKKSCFRKRRGATTRESKRERGFKSACPALGGKVVLPATGWKRLRIDKKGGYNCI